MAGPVLEPGGTGIDRTQWGEVSQSIPPQHSCSVVAWSLPESASNWEFRASPKATTELSAEGSSVLGLIHPHCSSSFPSQRQHKTELLQLLKTVFQLLKVCNHMPDLSFLLQVAQPQFPTPENSQEGNEVPRDSRNRANT